MNSKLVVRIYFSTILKFAISKLVTFPIIFQQFSRFHYFFSQPVYLRQEAYKWTKTYLDVQISKKWIMKIRGRIWIGNYFCILFDFDKLSYWRMLSSKNLNNAITWIFRLKSFFLDISVILCSFFLLWVRDICWFRIRVKVGLCVELIPSGYNINPSIRSPSDILAQGICSGLL